ncbi:MAG TPA: hypothetical protein VG649_01965 [Candidatus Angelobacter sp.]|jgi:hypothetical protein|nr:hypothetical protein [Candidatus Angelobacter sp.]
MQILFAMLIGVSVVLLTIVFFQVRSAQHQIADLTAMVRQGGTKTLVQGIERVRAGIAKDEVIRLLGTVDNPNNDEWFYYLDRHSGYLIKFDSRERVESVASWKS